MDLNFQPAELFGGAIAVEIPEGFRDISALRQVPDHQEVYLDGNGFASVVFDVTERVGEVSSDEEALRFHLDDVVDSGEGVRVWESKAVGCEKVPHNVPTLHLLATTTTPPRSSSSAPTPICTLLSLLLIRLEAQETDIVITVNVPFMPGAYDADEVDIGLGRFGRLGQGAERMMERVRGSFEIRDYGLFGAGGDPRGG